MRMFAQSFIVFTLLFGSSLISPTFAYDKKLSKAEYKKLSEPIPFLSFDQIAQLEFNQRIKYLRSFEKAAKNAAHVQTLFKDSYFANAQIEFPGKNHDLYAFLVGGAAFADGGRGEFSDDRCIHALFVSNYPKSGSQQPFECMIQKSCVGANGPGFYCNYFLTGIPESFNEACVPMSQSHRATPACLELRADLANKDRNRGIEISRKATNYFKFETGGQINKSDLVNMTDANGNPTELANILTELLATAYTYESRASLISVIATYNKLGINFPVSAIRNPKDETLISLTEFVKTIDPSQFNNDFKQMGQAINQIHREIDTHCDAPLKPNTIAAIRSGKTSELAKQLGRRQWISENRRSEALARIDKVGTPTHRNVLEVEECQLNDQYKDESKRALENVRGTFPIVRDDMPPGSNPPPVNVIPDSDANIQAAGCARDVVADDTQLHMAAARCMVCMAEKALQNTTKAEVEGDKKKFDERGEPVSTKWFSLMSTMITSCGEGEAFDSDFQAPQAAKMMEAFGFCAANTYDWNPKGLSGEEQNTVRFWQNEAPLIKKLKGDYKVQPDKDAQFRATYGISYCEAAKIFCDRDRTKKSWNPLKYIPDIVNRPEWDKVFGCSITGADPNKPRKKLDGELRFESRKRLGDHAGQKRSPATAALGDCLKESFNNAQRVFNNSSMQCMGFKSVRDQRVMLEDVKNDLDKGDTNVLFTGGTCMVAVQKEIDKKNPNNVAVLFEDPSRAHTTTNYNFARIRAMTNPGGASAATLTLFRQNGQTLASPIPNLSNYSYSYRTTCNLGDNRESDLRVRGEAK